jgi:hypothetical protein
MNGCMSWYMVTFSVVAKDSHVNPKSGELSYVIANTETHVLYSWQD